jgi:RNA polymerase sigma-70 factor (ECF subfamily)
MEEAHMSTMQELPPLELQAAAEPVETAAQPRPLLRVVPDVPLDFDDVVRSLTPRLQRYATRRLGDVHEAEELVQEALLRAYKNREELLTEDDVAAWTTVVVGRLVIDRLRVRGRSVNVAEVPEGVRVGRDTADVVVARDEARMALDALDSMPARQAAVLWAREVEGQGYDEIGARFGMTEPAVRSILTRARKALRKEYALRGGTMPVAGLSALAPWIVGMRWADRLRSAASRLAAPVAIGALSLGVLGGALGTSPWGGSSKPSVVVSTVSGSQAASTKVVPPPAAPAKAVAPARVTTPKAVVARVRPARTLTEDTVKICASGSNAGAGAESCMPGADPTYGLYLTPRLPDNPTGVRDIGIKADTFDCRALPATPLTTCTTNPSTGGTR